MLFSFADSAEIIRLFIFFSPMVSILLKVKSFDGTEVFIPQYSEIVCEFLYGKNWSIPAKKKNEYIITIIGGRPFIARNKFNFGKIFSNLAIKFTS